MKYVTQFVRKIARNYLRLTDSNFLIFAQKVVNLTGASKALANAIPTMADMQAAIDDYSQKLTDAKNRDTIMVGLKNTARAVYPVCWTIFLTL